MRKLIRLNYNDWNIPECIGYLYCSDIKGNPYESVVRAFIFDVEGYRRLV